MKKTSILRCIALLISLCMLLPCVISCAQSSYDAETQADDQASTNDEYVYEFPTGVNFEGRTYNILNCYKDQWQQLCLVTSHELLGEAINDAVYKRTIWLEETLNCELNEINVAIGDVQKTLDVAIDSGDNSYAVAYMQAKNVAAEMMSNRLTQLDYVENLKLDEDYWSQQILDASSINNRHYMAASEAHLQQFDGAWAVFFNTQTLLNNDIELPYDLVRNHKWTLEQLVAMSRNLATLNGDDSWTFNVSGNSRYGFATHWVGISMLLFGVDAQFGEKDLYDMPYLTASTPEFTNRAQDIAAFCSELGTFRYATPDSTKPDEMVDSLFINGRIAMGGLQIYAMNKVMKSGIEFGIVPFPMYNEDQEDYNVSSSITATFMTIPYGYAYTEDIGLIMDAMSYEADKTLEQVYYIDHLELKSNDGDYALDNIEMLNLIREKLSCDTMVISGLDSSLHTQMCYAVRDGGGTITSTYQQYAPTTEIKFSKLRIFFGIK